LRSSIGAAVALGFSLFVSTPGRAADPNAGFGLVRFDGVSVGAAERGDISRLTEAGILATEGSRSVVLNLVGELKGKAERDGEVGVILVPDTPPFEAWFRSRRWLPVSQELVAKVSAGDSSYFMAKHLRFDVGFNKYHVVLFNTTGSAVVVSVFAYGSR